MDGIPQLDGFSCLYRSKFIVDGEECQKAFLHCCTEVMKHREAEVEVEARMNLARSRFFLSSITLCLQFFCLMLVCMCTFSRKK